MITQILLVLLGIIIGKLCIKKAHTEKATMDNSIDRYHQHVAGKVPVTALPIIDRDCITKYHEAMAEFYRQQVIDMSGVDPRNLTPA